MNGHLVEHDRSIGDLLGTLANETSTLVRQEVALAKSEITEKARFVAGQSAQIAVGALIAIGALQTLLFAGVLGLALVVPGWAAALIVGAVAMGVALALVLKGVASLKHGDLFPTQTLLSIEENKSWLKNQIQ